MIEESYCSFDLAKKLFEKGLPQGLDSEFAYTVRECHSYADFHHCIELVKKFGVMKVSNLMTSSLHQISHWFKNGCCRKRESG